MGYSNSGRSKGKTNDKKKKQSSASSKNKSTKDFKKPGKFHKPFEKRESKEPMPKFSDEIRLNKFLSNAGICSRREADVLIGSGVVMVNDKIVTELGYKIKPGDNVKYDGETINAEKKRYVLLNKPKDYITTMDDPWGRKTVMGLVLKACKERVYPVGRLDRDTTGLLLFTNDGDMAKKLTHPKYKAEKVYHVTTNKNVKVEDLERLRQGLALKDGITKVDEVSYVDGKTSKEVGVKIHSGKNRIVRRMFEHMGYEIVKLDRVQFANLTKKDLPRGFFRHLSENEVSFLKMN